MFSEILLTLRIRYVFIPFGCKKGQSLDLCWKVFRAKLPKLAQDGPKMAPRWPKIAQNGPKMAPTWSKMVPSAEKLELLGRGSFVRSFVVGSLFGKWPTTKSLDFLEV